MWGGIFGMDTQCTPLEGPTESVSRPQLMRVLIDGAFNLSDLIEDLSDVPIGRIHQTPSAMSRKRREYLHAGVRLVWMIDPRQRSVAVYTRITEYVILDEMQKLDGSRVLPGLEIELSELFAELDRVPPPQASDESLG